ncbi:MAG: HAMP domain-containing sensor histidine kinase [Tissierellia bacterium]|nr:HAMP domain-containing sensor histidine kinase [Tissierellia bacterium]
MFYSLRDRIASFFSWAFRHYKKEIFVEGVTIDSFFFLFFFFGIFLGGLGDQVTLYYNRVFYIFIGAISIIIGLFFLLIKVLSREATRKVLLFHLLMEIKREKIYLFFFLANLLVLVLAYSFVVPEFSVVLLGTLRLMIIWEDMVIQNRILRGAIRETQSYEEISVYSPMINASSREALLDLTRIKDQLYQAAQESFQSQKMKSELITNISHDLKTPLTSIINYTDILSKKETMDEEARNYLKILGRNSERLKSMIVDLIDASKTGTGNVTVEPVLLDFSELVSQIYGDFDAEFEKKGLNFTYESNKEDILLYSDPNILGRIIENLFSNVYKYSLAHTEVLARSHVTEDKLFFNLKNTAKDPIEENTDFLQAQFIRAEKSRTTEGSGLGLYIASNLTEILGGQFRIVVDGDYFQIFIELPL